MLGIWSGTKNIDIPFISCSEHVLKNLPSFVQHSSARRWTRPAIRRRWSLFLLLPISQYTVLFLTFLYTERKNDTPHKKMWHPTPKSGSMTLLYGVKSPKKAHGRGVRRPNSRLLILWRCLTPNKWRYWLLAFRGHTYSRLPFSFDSPTKGVVIIF